MYAVLRHDAFQAERGVEASITVVQVWPTAEEAEHEARRLNEKVAKCLIWGPEREINPVNRRRKAIFADAV